MLIHMVVWFSNTIVKKIFIFFEWMEFLHHKSIDSVCVSSFVDSMSYSNFIYWLLWLYND